MLRRWVLRAVAGVGLCSPTRLAAIGQDPLAELVKITPRSLGVGMYQHDVPPAKLDTVVRA